MYADLKLIVFKPMFPQILCGIASCLLVLQLALGVVDYVSEKKLTHGSKEVFTAIIYQKI